MKTTGCVGVYPGRSLPSRQATNGIVHPGANAPLSLLACIADALPKSARRPQRPKHGNSNSPKAKLLCSAAALPQLSLLNADGNL